MQRVPRLRIDCTRVSVRSSFPLSDPEDIIYAYELVLSEPGIAPADTPLLGNRHEHRRSNRHLSRHHISGKRGHWTKDRVVDGRLVGIEDHREGKLVSRKTPTMAPVDRLDLVRRGFG